MDHLGKKCSAAAVDKEVKWATKKTDPNPNYMAPVVGDWRDGDSTADSGAAGVVRRGVKQVKKARKSISPTKTPATSEDEGRATRLSMQEKKKEGKRHTRSVDTPKKVATPSKKETPIKKAQISPSHKETPSRKRSVDNTSTSGTFKVPKTHTPASKARGSLKPQKAGPKSRGASGKLVTLLRYHGMSEVEPRVHVYNMSQADIMKAKTSLQAAQDAIIPEAIPSLPDVVARLDPIKAIPRSRTGALAYKAWLERMVGALTHINYLVARWDQEAATPPIVGPQAHDSVDDSVDDPVDHPVDDSVDDPVDHPVDDPVDDSVDHPKDDPVPHPVDDPMDAMKDILAQTISKLEEESEKAKEAGEEEKCEVKKTEDTTVKCQEMPESSEEKTCPVVEEVTGRSSVENDNQTCPEEHDRSAEGSTQAKHNKQTDEDENSQPSVEDGSQPMEENNQNTNSESGEKDPEKLPESMENSTSKTDENPEENEANYEATEANHGATEAMEVDEPQKKKPEMAENGDAVEETKTSNMDAEQNHIEAVA